MLRIIHLLVVVCLLGAEEMPAWILPGILCVETRSSYREDGTICYVDKRRGKAGERSAFQITKGAFNMVRHRGEMFWWIEVDQVFAEDIARRYLTLLHKRWGNWDDAVAAYNAGSPTAKGLEYAARVKAAGE